MSRNALYLGCVGTVIFGFLIIFWAEEAREWHNYHRVSEHFTEANAIILQILAVAGIVLATLNIFVNIMRERKFYLVLGIMMVFLAIITLSVTGLQFREYEQSQINSEAWN